MAPHVPEPLKAADINRFALRAAQLEKYKPIIAYWLEYYIVQQIIGKGLHTTDDACMQYTTDLMEKLERTKAELGSEAAINDEVAAQAYVEQFALDIFQKADNAVRANKATAQTADTFRAAGVFLDLLNVWGPLDQEHAAKARYAKYHALRIAKALKAGEDPNLSNPERRPTPTQEAPPLDPSDPEVQRINGTASSYQPTVEDVSDSSHPTPTVSAPSNPPADTATSATSSPTRNLSVSSAGGGYFPRVPTFTSDTAEPNLPTAPMDDTSLSSAYAAPQPPSQPSVTETSSDPTAFYQSPGAAGAAPAGSTPFHHLPPSQPPFAPSPSYTSPPAPHAPPQPPSAIPAAHGHTDTSASGGNSGTADGPYRTDDESLTLAAKRARFAISALNFDDVNTAVKELREALRVLGAR